MKQKHDRGNDLELAQEEEPSLQPKATYPVWSSLNSHEAAHQLAQLLEAEKSGGWNRPDMRIYNNHDRNLDKLT